jgi:hypothetical protein
MLDRDTALAGRQSLEPDLPRTAIVDSKTSTGAGIPGVAYGDHDP